MTEAPDAVLRRVVIVLDSDERTARLVREALRLALAFGTEVEGLFVEDEALLALAGHAFASRLGLDARRTEFGAADVVREWAAQSARVRRAIEQEADRRAVRARFAVCRGPSRQVVIERLDEGDLVLVGWGGWAPSAARRAPVRVLYDGSPAAERALSLAERLLGEAGVLAIWVQVSDEAELEPIEARLRERLAHLAGRLRIAPIVDPSAATLRHVVAARPGGLLLVPRTTAVAQEIAGRSLAARFPSSVILVGDGDEVAAGE